MLLLQSSLSCAVQSVQCSAVCPVQCSVGFYWVSDPLTLQANNLVFHTAVEHFSRSCREGGLSVGGRRPLNGAPDVPHIITSSVEHDSVTLMAKHLQKEGRAGGSTLTVLELFRLYTNPSVYETRGCSCRK